MKFYILKAKIDGIKNINKEIELSFYKKQLQKKFDSTGYNVKAIYGMNGAGKTGIIEAFDIYKGFVTEESYLTINNNRFLINIINQETQRFFMKVTFVVVNDDNIVQDVYEHSFTLICKDGNYVVQEELLKSIGLKINCEEKTRIIYKSVYGTLTESYYVNRLSVFQEISQNLLEKQSMASIFLKKKNIWDTKSLADYGIVLLLRFALKMTIVLNETYKDFVNVKSLLLLSDALESYVKQINNDNPSNTFLSDRIYYDDDKAIISPNKKEQYEARIARMTEFLKVFVPTLDRVDIKYEENGQRILCENIMVYKNNNRISKKYESTGVKKLMNLYDAFVNLNSGGIVLIDEFDANIHDVLLTKLVDYVRRFAKGQFIFTTHNLAPMSLLQKDKNSIDFLSCDSSIVSWIKNGNSVASNMYRNGLIENSPFNLDAEDFLGVFDDEAE